MKNINTIKLLKVNKDELLNTLDHHLNQLEHPTDYSAFIQVLKDFQEAIYRFYEHYQLTQFRFYGNTSQMDLKELYEHNLTIQPEVTIRQNKLKNILYAGPYMQELKNEFGDNMYYDIQNSNYRMNDKAKDLMLQENKINKEVVEFKSQSKVNWEGEEVAVSKLYSYTKDNDRVKRKKAFDSIAQYYTENRTYFYGKLIELIKIRNEFARELGFESYVEYSLTQWNRIGYDYQDIKRYRDAVVKNLKDVYKDLFELKKKNLNRESITYYDNNYFEDGFPKLLKKDETNTIDKLKEILGSLSPKWFEVYQSMLDAQSVDYMDRPNKVNMGYATYVSTIDTPLIYSQFQNNDQDVRVLTHEFGHALQFVLSYYDNPKKFFIQGTQDTVEIFSHAMEMLCLGGTQLFFGEAAEKYTILNYSGHLLLAMSCALGDEFQEKIYKLEDPTIESIQSIYRELQKHYTGNYFDSTENEYFINGDRWLETDHYFSSPFYLIDYSLAIMNALNIYKIYKDNPSRGIEIWELLAKHLDNLNYKNITNIIPELKSPFDSQFVDETTDFAKREMKMLLNSYKKAQTAS